jgi:putative phosphoribosyl transferase
VRLAVIAVRSLLMPIVFVDRDDAGKKLGKSYNGPRRYPVVLGIPRGGIPVGYYLAAAIGGYLDVIVVRKLPIPHNPEAGFGAVAPDGSRVLNEDMLRGIRLSREEIDRISDHVLQEVKRREKVYRGSQPFPELEDRDVVITDDGLATGFTMIAAIKMARTYGPASVSAAVPVSPSSTARNIEHLVDYFHCLKISDHYPFTVASFYHDFHDMSDEEVIIYLDKAREEGQNEIEYSKQGEQYDG